ncbi:MAG: hypothetical protein A2086_05335 [Spirochaetes bacterium GWD1_27_9]|nr:MAG: hypothetical protein A2Z98_05260 [Spirochaetes bacterium GWB1_27_13]OHD26582.1 MAG: hypothetical protein A2Y34_10340 [Spirochaetes bacterium GWC1_27_15]OHD45600.1 MAG: hypothetical protein A2086_05335 [Spirochaetes bacterium GWD1_27_9]
MKNIFFIFFLVIAGMLNALDYNVVEKNGIKLSWKINKDFIDIKIEAPTRGWISVGFDPTQKMKDANFIIACVKDGKVLARDDFGNNYVTHKSDVELGGTDDIKNLTGKETDNSTEIYFSIPIDSGDKFDTKLTKGKHKIILAYSASDDFKYKHTNYTKIEIEIK